MPPRPFAPFKHPEPKLVSQFASDLHSCIFFFDFRLRSFRLSHSINFLLFLNRPSFFAPLRSSILEGIGMEVNRTDLSTFKYKQSPIAMKKLALRAVQNDNRTVLLNHSTKSCSPGPPTVDAKKFLGIKRLKPESSPNCPCYQSLAENDVNEHLVDGDRNVDKEITKRRITGHNNTSYAPVVASLPTASLMTFSPGRPSIPHFLEKPDNGVAVDSNHLNVTTGSEVSDSVTYNGKYVKHCDESDQRDYVHILRCLSPRELSGHAAELEKRSIHLSFEEGKEIQRMKALNILGNSL